MNKEFKKITLTTVIITVLLVSAACQKTENEVIDLEKESGGTLESGSNNEQSGKTKEAGDLENDLNSEQHIKYTEVIGFEDKALERVVRVMLNKPDGDLCYKDVKTIKAIEQENAGIKTIEDIRWFTSLEILDLSNSVESGSYNEISDLKPLEGLYKLKKIVLTDGNLEDVSALSNLSQLEYVSLSTNNISDITPLEKLIKIKYLSLSDNPITDIGSLEDLKYISTLDLSDTQIKDFSVIENFKELTSLSMWSTSISNLDFGVEKLIKLESLDVSYNSISDIAKLAELTNLTHLSLTSNQIHDVAPLAKLKNLEYLYLMDNPIQDFSPIRSYYDMLKEKDFVMGEVQQN